MIPLVNYARMEPNEMESAVNSMKQLPFSFLAVDIRFISLQRLDSHIASLFDKLGILQDQDLVNVIISMLLNARTSYPDVMVHECQQLLGSQSRVYHDVFYNIKTFVLSMWKYLSKCEIRRLRLELIKMGDSSVITRRAVMSSENLPPMKWEIMEAAAQGVTQIGDNTPSKEVVLDYKRRRQSYRAKMTHMTKRTPIQEQRDLVNMRMMMLAEDDGYELMGPIDRVTTKTTPQEIEREERQKRITPRELQFKNPLEARNDIRRKLLSKEKM